LSYEQLTDPQEIARYFDDDIVERIAIHKLLFEQFAFNHDIIAQLVKLLVDAQVHSEETFAKNRLMLWSAFCRFFGMDFMRVMLQEVEKLTDNSGTVATHLVAAEIFAGYLCSLKSRSYAEVEQAATMCKPFVTNLVEGLNPEFHTVWCFSFLAAVTATDPRRLFWLFEHMIECVPKNDRLRTARAVSFVLDILNDVVQKITRLRSVVEELAAQPLLSEAALEFDVCLRFVGRYLT
jgi:hypothetical protein